MQRAGSGGRGWRVTTGTVDSSFRGYGVPLPHGGSPQTKAQHHLWFRDPSQDEDPALHGDP